MNLNAYVQDEQIRVLRSARLAEARLARELKQSKLEQGNQAALTSSNKNLVLGKAGSLTTAV